jgi:hypothetical protein
MQTPPFFGIFHNFPDHIIALPLYPLASYNQITENRKIEPEILVDGGLFGQEEVETVGGFVEVGVFVD